MAGRKPPATQQECGSALCQKTRGSSETRLGQGEAGFSQSLLRSTTVEWCHRIAPFADVKAAVDKTLAWEKREAYSPTEVHWLIRVSESYTLYIVLLGAHAGLRVSEMKHLKWEDIDLPEGTLKVVSGKGGKTTSVNLSSTSLKELEHVPLDKQMGYLLPARCRIAVCMRLEAACRQVRIKFRVVHLLRLASGTRLLEDTSDVTLTVDHLRHSSLDTARGYARRSNTQLNKAVQDWWTVGRQSCLNLIRYIITA